MVVVANPLSNHAQVSITPYHLLRKLGGQDVIFLKARIWKVSLTTHLAELSADRSREVGIASVMRAELAPF